jgi:hypothetical protein
MMISTNQNIDNEQLETFTDQHIDDLLQIASFLTSYQGVFFSTTTPGCPPSLPPQPLGWITVQDVVQVLKYRLLLEQHDQTQACKEAYEYLQPYFLLHLADKESNDSNSANNSRKDVVPPRIHAIHKYWQKVEVLVTRVLVMEDVRSNGNLYWGVTLESSSEAVGPESPTTASTTTTTTVGTTDTEDSNDPTPSSLGLLEKYWQAYIQKFVKKTDGSSWYEGALSVLPDQHTWMEWVAGLGYNNDSGGDTRHPAVTNTTNTNSSNNSNNTDSPYSSALLGKGLKFAQAKQQYNYSRGDLKVLLQQSRHCSASLRHLLQLFEVVESKRDDDDNDDNVQNTKDPHPFVAKLRGNLERNLVWQRVKANTPLVEKLVAHAIQQQVTVVTPTVMQHLRQTWHTLQGEPLGHKSTEQEQNNVTTEPPTKRARYSSLELELTPTSVDDDRALIQACERFLLRTWGRRHATALVHLFHAKPTPEPYRLLHLSPHTTDFAKYVKDALHSSDRCFTRIDRRIALDHYSSFDDFSDTVKDLLKVFLGVLSLVKVEEGEYNYYIAVSEALADWKRISRSFADVRQSSGIARAALSLVESDVNLSGHTDSIEALCNLLDSCVAPWVRECEAHTCDKSNAEGTFHCCAACERWHHNKPLCSSGQTCKVDFFIKSYPPLSNIFAMKRPVEKSNLTPIDWERLELIVKRRRDDSTNELQKLGLLLLDTDHCGSFRHQWEAGRILAWETEKYNGLIPLKIEHKGFLIGGIQGTGKLSVSEKWGLRVRTFCPSMNALSLH